MHLFSNIIGVFVFDDNFDLVDKMLFKSTGDYQNRSEFIEKIKSRHKDAKDADEKALQKILLHFKDTKFFNDFYDKNIQLTRFDVKNSVNDDVLLIQAINSTEG